MMVAMIFATFSCKEKSPKQTVAEQKTVLHRGNGSEPGTLDPHAASGDWENNVIGDLFLGLLTEAADGSPIAGAAESWKVSTDGLVYTFALRKDGKWSDGEPVTADDYVFAFRRILDPNLAAKYANLLYTIKNGKAYNTGEAKKEDLAVKAIDAHTLEVTLESPAPYFLTQLTHYTSFAVPKHVVEQHGKDWIKPENIVSNGAYKLAEWNAQNYIKIVKNELFYDAANVHIEEVYFYPIEDRAAALKRFRAGELDMNMSFPSEQYQWLQENMPTEVDVTPKLGIQYYAINQRLEKYQDPKVREALNLVIDRKILVEKVQGLGQVEAYAFVPPMGSYQPAQFSFASMSMDERIARAKNLLAEAGYSEENPLTVEIKYNTSEGHKKNAIAIASMWKEIGINTTMLNSETAVHYDGLKEGDFDIGRAGWIGDYADAQNFLMLFEPIVLNYGAYSNDAFNKLMTTAAITSDLTKRAKILQQAEQIMLDDFGIIPLYYPVSSYLVGSYIKGWQGNAENIHRSRWISKE